MRGTTNVPEVSVIIRKGDDILFVLREKTGYADGFYALPGGHVEHGEAFSAAAVREALEEVNVKIHAADLKPVLSMHRLGRDADDVRAGIFFEALKWSGTPKNMEPERHRALAWFKSSDLPFDKIMAFQVAGLQAIQRGDMYHELGWHEPHHK
ncbi:MAG TPA: NUDIX domain-containing protein [Patescibacteria group bacterium]|nr:NUDIX domain-containing protein [Patescibacteria group bacterium]